MPKKTNTTKQPKSIKVSTLVKVALIVGAIIASYVAGSMATTAQNAKYNAEVTQTAKELLTELKSSQQK